MKKQKFISLLFCSYVLSGMTITSNALAVVNGTVLMAKGVVTATDGTKANRTLAKGADVNQGDIINTASNSFAVIRMLDRTKLTLKPNTTIAVGVFDTTEGKEEGCINLVKGGLRTVTGLIGQKRPEAFQVDTPIASIGIRGTDFVVRICDDTECLEDEQDYFGEDYNVVDSPTLPESNNAEVPAGLYSSCETGVIAVSQCAGQVEDFKLGSCRINQQQDCLQIELSAGQAGYVSYSAEQVDERIGILPLVPHFLNRDPHFELSELPDDKLELIELFKDEFSTEDQCEFTQ